MYFYPLSVYAGLYFVFLKVVSHLNPRTMAEDKREEKLSPGISVLAETNNSVSQGDDVVSQQT